MSQAGDASDGNDVVIAAAALEGEEECEEEGPSTASLPESYSFKEIDSQPSQLSNILFYILIFLLGYSIALIPQFRLFEDGQLSLPVTTCTPLVSPADHKLSLGTRINEHIRAAMDDSKSSGHDRSSSSSSISGTHRPDAAMEQVQQKEQDGKKPKQEIMDHIPDDIDQYTFYADRSYDPPLFYTDGVGLGRPFPGRLADQNRLLAKTPPLTRHSWQLAPVPAFLLEGCPDPEHLQDLPPVPQPPPPPPTSEHSDRSTSTTSPPPTPPPPPEDPRTEVIAYLPKSSPKEVMEKGWSTKHALSWEAQRALFDTIHHPLSASAVTYNSNQNHWHKLNSLDNPEYNMKWDQYVPLVMHFQEMQPNKERKCRGSTGFELRLDCYDSLNPPPNALRNDSAESFTYRTRPHLLDHGNGVYSVRILLEKPGYCHFQMFAHETVDHDGNRHVHTQTFYDRTFSVLPDPPFSDYLQFPYFRTVIHVQPAQIKKQFEEFAASSKGRKNAAKYMDPTPAKAVTPPAGLMNLLSNAAHSYQAQLALSLRLRRRRECNIDDYTQMTSWTGAWYKLPREQIPCIRRRDQEPYYDPLGSTSPPSQKEEEEWEKTQLQAAGSDPFLGPLCSMDAYPEVQWTWPGDTPDGEPQWVFSREECYIHLFSAKSLWTHWHDQRFIFQMDSNGQDVVRNIARNQFGLKSDVVPHQLPRDIMLTKLSPSETNLDAPMVLELLRTCRDDSFQHDATLSFSNKFFDIEGYANHIGISIWEHAQWLKEFQKRIHEVDVPIGAFLIDTGLHDRDLIRHGFLSPWRSGVKRRPSWFTKREVTLNTRSTNFTYEFQRMNFFIGFDRGEFDAAQLNAKELQSVTEDQPSKLLDDSASMPKYLQSGILPTTMGPASTMLASTDIASSTTSMNANKNSNNNANNVFGPPSSHLAFKLEGVLQRLEESIGTFRQSNYEKANKITLHAIRQALQRKVEQDPTYRAPTGSVAAIEQLRMSNPSSPFISNDLLSLLPLAPVYLWRTAPTPAGGARSRESSTTTLHIMNSEMRSAFQQKMHQHKQMYRTFVDGASATSRAPLKPKEELPLCDEVRRDSIAWIAIDTYTVTYPWHWYESHSDGSHYGKVTCYECNNCQGCMKQNFIDQWATFAKTHAMTLYKELHLKHAFNPFSTFTTNACRVR